MNIPAVFSKSPSASQPSLTTAASADAPKFIRPTKDGAPALPAKGLPDIDPNAPPQEKELFYLARDLAYGGVRQGLIRLTLLFRETSTHEQFTFKQKPASIQTQGSRIEINVGSDDDGSAGQLTAMNTFVEQATGTLQDPQTQVGALRQAITALYLGMAQQKNMPLAAEALHRVRQHLENYN